MTGVTVAQQWEEMSLLNRALMMEAESTSETSVSFYHATRRNIPEDGHHQLRKRRKVN
jgi:hypothetical protein